MVSGSVKSLGLASRSWSCQWARVAAACPAAGRPAGARSPGFKFTSGLESVIGGKLVLGVVLGLVDGDESIKLKNEVCMPRCGPPAGRLVADPGFGPGRVRTG